MKNTSGRRKFPTKTRIVIFLYATLGIATMSQAAAPSVLPPQQQQVTGTVTDQNGLSIPGVAVRVKNSSTGTVTNPDGVYTINAAPDAILIFTYLGFQTMEVPVDSRNEINIRLEEDVTALGEVEINAGYYHTTRRESTGNISRVTSEEIDLQPVLNPIEALQGRMAGVEIISSSTRVGGATTIKIRGTNSLREDGNYPMYIIDGVPVASTPFETASGLSSTGIDPLNTMNLSNIESIEVLKDADATAIYGSRGANGVVLITTKRAKDEKLTLQTNIYKGVSTVPGRIDLLNTQQYLQLRKQAFKNNNTEPDKNNAYDLVTWDQNRYTDWQDYLFGETSPVTDINLALSGGNEQTNFRLAGSYHNVGSVFLGDKKYNKITTSIQGNHTSKDKRFNINLALNYGLDENHLFGHVSLVSTAFRLPPNAPQLFNDDGSLHWEEWANAGLINPLEGYFNSSTTKAKNLTSSLSFTYELFPGLNFKTNFGYTTYDGDELNIRPKRSYSPANQQNREHSSITGKTERISWIIEPQFTFSKQINNHSLEAIIGGTIQQNEQDYLTLLGEGYITESLIGNLSAAETITSYSHPSSQYKYMALFGRIGYNWKQKYFINLTGRRDGSSRFGSGKRIANFGAIGAAWIFSEENAVKKNLSFFSFGKLRGSYGTTGNDQIGDYGYLDAYDVTIGPGGLYPSQLANPDFSWEVNKKLEFGIELGFLNDDINLGVSWYRNKSSNQLVGYPLPLMTGFSEIQANFPATVENTGFEVEASSYNIQRENFQWQTSLNFTIPKNELTEYPNFEDSPFTSKYKVGYPLNISFRYQYSGLDPETGYYTVKDINEDGRINTDDRKEVWIRDKQFYGGISNNFRYKNFSLRFFLQFTKQEGTFEMFEGGSIGNQHVEVLDALEGKSRFQRLSADFQATQAYLNVLNSGFPIVDASYIKLKTLNIGYSLTPALANSLNVSNAYIFINGQNLLTITDYKGLDPEVPFGGLSFAGLRTITAGIQLTF